MAKSILILIAVLMLLGCSGKSKEELFEKGMAELGNGNPNGAIVFFKNALEVDPNFASAREKLAVAYIEAGRFANAERELMKLVVQMPQKIEVKLQLAKVYNSMHRSDDALKVLNEYLANRPADADALEYKGIAFAQKKDGIEAERFLLESIRANAKQATARLELAKLYASSGRDADALKQINEIIAAEPKNSKPYYLLAQIEASRGNKAKALDIYKKVAESSKSDPMAYYRMGILYIEQQDLTNAEKIVANMKQLFPKKGETARLQGILELRKKNYSEALASLMNSVKIQPNIEGYYYLGITQYSIGELESALSQFRAIIDRLPSHSRSRLMIAMILLQQKRTDDAITEVRKVIELDPKNGLAHNLLGSAYLAKGQVEDGMRELTRATELDPAIVDAHVKKGLVDLGRGREREGEAELLTAVKVNPELLNSRLLLFSYYMKKNNPRKAETTLLQGLAGKPSDAPLYNALAGVKLSQHKIDEALQNFRLAKERDPAFSPAYFNLATYYVAKGEHDKAITEYQAVLSKDPKNLRALLGLAAIYELKGREKEALDSYLRAKDTRQDAAYLALAGYYSRKKDAGKALNILDDALKVNNKNLAAMESKGKLLTAENKYKDALRVYDDMEQVNQGAGIGLKIQTYMVMKNVPKAVAEAQRMITLNPNAAAGYMILAAIHESQNDLSRAVDELKKGIRVEPQNLQAKVQLGNLQARRKDYSSAIAILKESIRNNSEYAPAHFALGAVYEQTGKKKEAVNKYRDALTKSTNYVPALNNLAYLLAEGYGDKEEALQLAISAYRAEPGNPGVLDTLGYSLLRNNKHADAVKVLEKAAALLPNNPTVLYHYSLALNGKGEKVKSMDILNKALQHGAFPESALALQLRSQLSQAGKGQSVK
ncbi:MAG: PEP-CTERM system TPR-repeat protein PrsT [Geobacter sp.]|nr:PEP-CTERM system TPR-repeat protein PrsT [Geobacter sp.]